MGSIRLSIVIPVYNKFSLTRDCLVSLREHLPEVPTEVIVVDNASSDETASELGPLGFSLFGERFVRIRQQRNINFGPASNAGAERAGGELLFFLNNDTILTRKWFEPLESALSDRVGMVGPLLMYPAGDLFFDRVQHLGVACKPQLHPVHLHEFFPASHHVVRKPRILQFLTGAAMLLSKNLFTKVGGFHGEYINGGEDLDLSVQVCKAGYSLACIPESRIYHLQSQTPGRHDHEKHNARILKERCLLEMYPDLHLHLHNDGYELSLNDHLVPFARLPERRYALMHRAFCRDGSEPDRDSCMAMIEREPLFAPAYERLAAIFEGAGEHDRCASIRFLQTRFFPGSGAGVRLLEAARLAENMKLIEEGERIIKYYANLGRESELPAMAREMIAYGEHLGQPAISELYGRWLAERSTGAVSS